MAFGGCIDTIKQKKDRTKQWLIQIQQKAIDLFFWGDLSYVYICLALLDHIIHAFLHQADSS